MYFIFNFILLLFSYLFSFIRPQSHSQPKLVSNTSQPMFWKDNGLKNSLVNPTDPRIITSHGDGIIVTTEQSIAPHTGIHKYSLELLDAAEPQDIYVGVAPIDIDPSNFRSWCGWYLHPSSATLISGPPHNYSFTPVPLAAGEGHVKYPGNLFPGDVITLTLDTDVGSLTFSLNRKKLGVAYTSIPLSKPFVISAMLGTNNVLRVDPVSSSSSSSAAAIIAPPRTLRIGSNDVTMTWGNDDDVSGDDVTYYVTCEVAGGYADGAVAPIVYAGPARECTVKGLVAGAAYDFFVGRRGSDAWSEPLRVTIPGKAFSDVKLLRNSVEARGKRFIDVTEDCMSATSRKAGSWHALMGDGIIFAEGESAGAKKGFVVKIVSLEGSSSDMFIGVGPVDVDPNLVESHPLRGWFLSTYRSNIVSGPPHNAQYLNYDAERGHVKTGDTVEVVCELVAEGGERSATVSFVVNGRDLGVAFRKVPLDKPILPLVLMRNTGDSVEFMTK